MHPLLVLRAGDVVPTVAAATRCGEFPEMIARTVGEAWPHGWRSVDVRTDEPLPGLDVISGAVVTGSASSVMERAPWMLRSEAWLARAAAEGLPVLGICFGHQMLAQAMGGEVTRNPNGREIGSVDLERLADDPLFDGLPPTITVQNSHSDSVTRLPPGARVLARTALEPVAAYALGDHVRCVQFHPEMDHEVVRGYVEARSDAIRAEGLDPEALRRNVVRSEANGAILRNFVRHFVRK